MAQRKLQLMTCRPALRTQIAGVHLTALTKRDAIDGAAVVATAVAIEIQGKDIVIAVPLGRGRVAQVHVVAGAAALLMTGEAADQALRAKGAAGEVEVVIESLTGAAARVRMSAVTRTGAGTAVGAPLLNGRKL